ncbi:MAG: MinD/ParA family protein [Anaerolineales bacterium]|nr:MAG: MinD/ParA family protein [Anaerolineales bacterium]
MAKIVSVHSFRGGTGKSNTTANVATILASEGRRVGVVDTDLASPGIHVLFGMPGEEVTRPLNEFLWDQCAIQDCAHDMSTDLGVDGKLFLLPASLKPGAITRILRQGYDAQKLTGGFRDLIKALDLDVLMIDTHPGLNQETLLSLVISHAVVIVMRPDQQDYEGTGVTVQVARQLKVPSMQIVVNKVPTTFDPDQVRAQVQETYACEVGAVLFHSDEMMTLASGGIFSLHYPDHPLTQEFKQAAAKLVK